jgi:hypothetical protein
MISLEELVILPGSGRAVLCRVLGEQIEQLQELPFSFSDRHAIGGNRWLIAFIKEKDTAFNDFLKQKQSKTEAYIFRAKVESDGTLRRMPDVELPTYILNQTLAIKDDVLYLGGFQVKKESKRSLSKVNEGELAGFFDLGLDEPEWHPLPLPIDMQAGKSIDDVLVYDDKLVLVDNIMFPKYLFEYDISNPMAPVATKTIDLPNNGTYEHIHRGSINSNWMAILSGGVGRAGSSQYVSVFSLPNYEQVFMVSLLHSAFDLLDQDSFSTLEKELEKARNEVSLHDFAVVGGHLLIACGHHGLGVFTLPDRLQQYQEKQKQIEVEFGNDIKWYSRNNYGRSYWLSEIYKDDEHLRKYPQLEEVHKLVPLSDGRVVAISYGETNQKLEYMVLQF